MNQIIDFQGIKDDVFQQYVDALRRDLRHIGGCALRDWRMSKSLQEQLLELGPQSGQRRGITQTGERERAQHRGDPWRGDQLLSVGEERECPGCVDLLVAFPGEQDRDG